MASALTLLEQRQKSRNGAAKPVCVVVLDFLDELEWLPEEVVLFRRGWLLQLGRFLLTPEQIFPVRMTSLFFRFEIGVLGVTTLVLAFE